MAPPHSLFYFSFLPGTCEIFSGNNTAGSCPWGVTGDVSCLYERMKAPVCLVYQKVFAKEQMCISLRMVAWEPRIAFSELPLESLMLLHLLLREFINCEWNFKGSKVWQWEWLCQGEERGFICVSGAASV